MNRITDLIREVHRRSLWQVLGIYLVGSWIAYQVIVALTQGLGLPPWVPGFAVVLFIIGLPVVLATAFVQEGLPGAGARAPAGSTAPVAPPGTAASSETATPSGTASRPAPGDPGTPDHPPTAPGEPTTTAAPPTAPGASAQTPAPPASPRAPAPVPAAASPAPSAPDPFLTWRRAILSGIVAFLLLGITAGGYMGIRNAGIGPFGSLVAAGKIDEHEPILIADFHSPSGDTTIASVVTEAFRIDFARSTLVRPIEPSAVRDVLRRMGRTDAPRLDVELAREIAIREGINVVVAGEVAAAGSGWVVSARLLSPAGGDVLAAGRETARGPDDLVPAIDRLSRGLRERTGESLRTIHRAEPLARVTTASLPALEKYTQALRASGWEGAPWRSFELLEEAVRLDSTFAAAHLGLAIHYGNRYEPDLALTAIETALRYEDRLTEPQRNQARSSYHLNRREFAQAATALERTLAADSQNFAVLNNLGTIHRRMGDYVRAEYYYRRAIAADTARFFAYPNLADLHVIQGRFDEARDAFAAAVERSPAGWPLVGLAALPRAWGDFAEAEANLRRLLDDSALSRGVFQFADREVAFILTIGGRLEEAERRTEAAVLGRDGPTAAERWTTVVRLLNDFWIRGRADAGPRLAAAASLHDDLPLLATGDRWLVFEHAAACAWAGELGCARRLLDRAGHSGPAESWTGIDALLALAAIAVAEGDYAGAIRIFRIGKDGQCPDCEDAFVARVFERAGQPDSALAAYERYVASPSMDRIWPDKDHLARAHARLGELYEQRGDLVAAARHYARFVELWEHADPDLQPMVAEARRRLTGLGAER